MSLQDGELASDPGAIDDPRNDIRAAIASLTAPDDTPASDTTGEATENSEARARDEQGRFANKAGETAEPINAADTPAPAEAQQPERLQAPAGWSADAKTQWDKLPKAVQASLADDLQAGRLRPGGDASGSATNDPVLQVAREYEADARSAGVQPADYIRNTLGWAQALARDPYTYAPQLLRTLGIDPSRLVPQTQQQGTQGQPGSEVFQLRQELDQLKYGLTQRQQQEHQQRLAAVQSEIDAFASSPDAPHWAALDQAALSARISFIRSTNPNLPNRDVLKQAYEAEAFAQPETRARELARLMEAERAKAEAATKAAEQARIAEAAKRRAVGVRDSRAPMTSADPSTSEDTRATVARVMAELRAS